MQGGGRGRSSIVFVLDCSNSMASQVPAEGIGGDTSSRLVKAKGALATMLNERVYIDATSDGFRCLTRDTHRTLAIAIGS